ncbi:MAG: DUF6463 family protein [Deferribacteraceae bacterium]|jgi:hypothetical protein|nr:DUF6463 family protein [Deferribacteraceae bacterium]
MKIWKYSGLFLIITGIIHTAVGLMFGWSAHVEIIRAGLFNTIAQSIEHSYAFWFLICGFIIISFGQILHHYIKRDQRPAPLFFGYSMLIFAILGAIVIPVSGFWLFIPQALIIIIANKKAS